MLQEIGSFVYECFNAYKMFVILCAFMTDNSNAWNCGKWGLGEKRRKGAGLEVLWNGKRVMIMIKILFCYR